MSAVPLAATAGVWVRSPSQGFDGQFGDLALNRELQVRAGLGPGGRTRLRQQGGGVGEFLGGILRGRAGAPSEEGDDGDEGGEDRQKAGLHACIVVGTGVWMLCPGRGWKWNHGF